MRDRADEALPCNRPSTLRRAQGPQAQGPPLTVWLIKKAGIVRKRDFHKDKSLFLCQCQLLIVHLYPILDWRVVVLSSELLDSVLERPTSSTLLLYTFVIPA